MSTAPLPKRKRVTPVEYLAIERAAEFKSELIDGEMVAMAGGTRRHSRIAVNLVSQLDEHFRGSPREVFNSDMRVKVSSSGLYTYPDVSVACAPIEFEDANEDTLLNPRILIEVLSKSTENRDRGWKFEHYFDLPSVMDYVLVSQDRPFVEHFVRRADGRRMFEFVKGIEETLQLAAVDCSLALKDIYRGVQFGPEQQDEQSPAESD
ncbi:MAG: Uma2 family endonuclease [Pirellulaceae bacterium]|nr:Uma2 family endonuclease [Pirellulaceae bacterium]